MGETYRQAWLTPDTLPVATVCRALLVPDDPDIIAALYGAVLLLTKEENWEPFGAITPDAIAERMLEMWDEFVGEECSVIPSGWVAHFALTEPPTGWLECDGSELLIADYPTLYAAIGTTWGGDGRFTFAVPNGEGRVSLGVGQQPGGTDYGLGQVGGEEAHQLTEAELAAHDHTTSQHNHSYISGNYGTVLVGTGAPFPISLPPGPKTTSLETVVVNDAGGDSAHENRQPYNVFLTCIKI